ncbi:hypothetical protein [Sphingobium sp.]|uniref:hypothetical protein n=1 Tax=Sphingobium sp. TaxID=1912891 RepID=UPI003B3A150C
MFDLANLTPSHSICEDAPVGAIRVDVSGFMDIPSLESHFREMRMVVSRWRSQHRAIRVLVHAIDLMPHSPEGQRYVDTANASIYQPGDKIAVLVSSSLLKMQMRRMFNAKELMEFFISERAAHLWLNVAVH